VFSILDRALTEDQRIKEFGDQLLRLAQEVGKGQLWLNFGNVDHLSSLVLSKLIKVRNTIEAAGGQLVLCNLSPHLREIFTVTRLESMFCFQTEPEPTNSPEGLSLPMLTEEPAARQETHQAELSPTIILCDPDPARAERLLTTLRRGGLRALATRDLEQVARLRTEQPVSALAVPLAWPGSSPSQAKGTSPALLEFIGKYGHQMPVVIYADKERISIGIYCQALAAGARQVVNEAAPTFADDLRQTLQRLVRDHQAQHAEQEHLTGIFAQQGLLGQSRLLRDVFRRAIDASHFSDLPILLLGETGTGKQRLAEAIHRLDRKRASRPFLTLNCSAISKSLAESELFGHTRGAFSGAGSERLGLFRAANGGTLLLDEIGELSLEVQPKLLRVLQERCLLPVGADYEHTVDVRIMAATNQPLEEMVSQGLFREDLYQRLNVFRIHIPPLRQRPEDIEAQVRYFLKVYQPHPDQAIREISPQVLEVLRLLPWEGNTRQLENLVREMLANKVGGATLHLEDLPRWALENLAHVPHVPRETDSIEETVEQAFEQRLTLEAVMEDFERRFLQVALAKNDGNRTRTAAMLGLTPRSIFNKIKKYKLE
jgi:anti-anti-sigma factor